MKKEIKKAERETSTHIYFWGSFYSQWAKYPFFDQDLNLKFI